MSPRPPHADPNARDKPHLSHRGRAESSLPLDALEPLAQGCLVLDEAGRVIYSNTAAQRLLRREAASLAEASLEQIVGQAEAWGIGDGAAGSDPPGADDAGLDIAVYELGGLRLALLTEADELTASRKHIRALEAELRELKSTMAVSQELLRNNNTELNKSLDQLRQLNAELGESDRVRSEFLANTSHELRTPLNTIIGYLQFIADDLCEDTEERDRYIRNTSATAQHLLRLINDVLDVAKLESGRVSLCVENIDVERVFDDIHDMLFIQARERGLELIFEIAREDENAVRCDQEKLKQILINLTGNAIKFTHEGHVKVTLTPYPGEEATMLFSVEDTGIGIPRESREKVFERFVQADGSSTRQYEGTGLGLTISKKLVEMLGGQIWIVKSDAGKGTTVCFTMPGPAPENEREVTRSSLELPSMDELLPETF